jgi:hypothetical protein
MYLLEIVRLAKVGFPDLAQQGLAQVKELVLLVVPLRIGILRVEVVRRLPIYSYFQYKVSTVHEH